ncbi:hypothetical protein [Sphingopyxis sp. FD7]|uniref:hypothetical protein n=1 Tax=Sphingopyxis sp. FD7 TaxID=1914525 RepID=UPI000DC61B1E|nr:hypothetical protein [Sphingopyxis sp. FD7]BBB12247.1 hypothetical protein SPYCA_1505 [Sphingopyxis sp. FD7]
MHSVLTNGWPQLCLLAETIRGLFQPGLAKLVRRIVARHLRGNPEFRTHRYPRLMRLAMWIVRHPIRALAIVALLYAFAVLSTLFDRLPSFTLATDKQASVRDFWTVNIAVLAVQAALVGLVFPLVIAFVGLLNRGRASFASRLTIYIESSSAIFVGVSSLLLCVAIAAQLPFAAKMGDAGAAVTLLNLAWFAINVGALAYFVLRTIAFLHPERRAPIMRAYVANVIWPRELTGTVTANRWANVAGYGYLPAGDETDPFATGERARTWYSALWDGGEPRVSRRLRRKMRLVDVRLAILAPIVRAWLAQARGSDGGQVHDFVIPLQPGQDYEGDQVLARATLPLGPVARWAVRASLRFRRAPAEDGAISETGAILREMIADLIALIDTRQADEFADQLGEVIAFHAFLYRLAQLSDEDISYAQLESGQSLFGRALAEEWARAYRDMIRRAVERLPDEAEFMGRIAHAPAHIYRRVASEVTPKALQPILWMAQSIAYRLIDWALGEHRAETPPGAGGKRAYALSRQEETYARAWRELVAGWERLLQVIAAAPDRRERGGRKWDDLTRIAENVGAHLQATTQMTARAVWLGDTLATSWTCDLMLHWRIQAERAWDTRGAYWRVRSEGLTLETLELDWSRVEDLPLTQSGDTLAAPVVFGAIMHNAWRDHVVVLASLFIHWAIHAGAAETATRAARMLLHGEPHDRGDAGVHDDGGMSGADILISALRITGSGERFAEHSYAGRMDHLLEGLGQLGDSPWVSMRIYSSSGGLSFEALPEAQAIAIMATTQGSQAIDGDLRRLLTLADDEALRRRESYLRSLIAAFEGIDADRHGNLLAALVGPDDGPAFDVRRDHARQLVEQSLGVLTGHRDQAIVDAQIDPARVGAVAAAAGSQAFTPTAFPRHLFAEIVPTAAVLANFTLRAGGLSKGAYTDPPMAQAVVNEEEWWRDAMSGQVAAVVWWDVVCKADFQEIEGRTADEFWNAVRDGSVRIREAGHDPLLVIGNVTDPQWLLDWLWPHRQGSAPKPADLVITRQEGQVEGYEFTMNDTPVYRAQTAYGAAYLLPAQLLRRLRYHDYGDGLPVSLRFEPDAENPWRGTMHASFQREVELSDVEAYRIRWTDALDPSRSVSVRVRGVISGVD